MKAYILIVTLLSMAGVANAQTSLTSFATDSGGGLSEGGGYSLSSSIGQSVGGKQRSEHYSISSGFWGFVVAVGGDDAPALRIIPAARGVILAWPADAAGFQLQQTRSLLQPQWADVTEAPHIVGKELQVILPWEENNRFFRLERP